MKFQLYLTEGRSKEISEDDFIKLALTTCRDAISAYGEDNNNILLRGVSDLGKNTDGDVISSDFADIDPSKHNREANYAMYKYSFIMFENLPSWKSMPKRSKSVVGATYSGKSGMYGKQYMMFPENGARVAVANGGDLWSSFNGVLTGKKDDPYENMGAFSSEMDSALLLYKIRGGDSSWSAMLKACIEFDMKYKHSPLNTQIDGYRYFGRFFREYYKGNLIEALNKAFAPAPNNIKIMKPGDKYPPSREWWTDGYCIMMAHHNKVLEKNTWKKVFSQL